VKGNAADKSTKVNKPDGKGGNLLDVELDRLWRAELESMRASP
jgi:hypothetical protein